MTSNKSRFEIHTSNLVSTCILMHSINWIHHTWQAKWMKFWINILEFYCLVIREMTYLIMSLKFRYLYLCVMFLFFCKVVFVSSELEFYVILNLLFFFFLESGACFKRFAFL